MVDQGITEDSELWDIAGDLAKQGKTPMFVALDGRMLGVIGVADAIKPGAREGGPAP